MPRSSTPTAWAARARPAPSWAALAASPDTAFCFLRSTRVSFTARLRSPGFRSRSGLYDPSVNSEKGYEITPYPRLEAQLSYNLHETLQGVRGSHVAAADQLQPDHGTPWGTRCWTRTAGRSTADRRCERRIGWRVAVRGALAGGRLVLPGHGPDLDCSDLQHPDLHRSERNILRQGQGFAGMASLTFGGTKIAGGAGVSQLKLTPFEMEPYSQQRSSQAAARHLDRPLPDVLQTADVGRRIFPRAIHLVPVPAGRRRSDRLTKAEHQLHQHGPDARVLGSNSLCRST